MKELLKFKRVIGSYTTNKNGPLLLVTAAVHGNEPSGVEALEEVFKILKAQKPDINGTLVGLIGNYTALQKSVRFIDEDLNRTWTDETIKNKVTDSHEKREMFDILSLLEPLRREQRNDYYFIDCHTTSSQSLPYISIQDVGKNDSWAQEFPIHMIRGFSDIVKGTIDGYFSQQEMTGFTVEAGQHDSKNSKIYHEGIVWLALQNICDLNFNDLTETPAAVLKTINDTPPQKKLEIIYRFDLKESDAFKMKKGFENFQKIEKGEPIAVFNGKQINSVWDAYIFMPLYQAKGNDGFFVAKEAANTL